MRLKILHVTDQIGRTGGGPAVVVQQLAKVQAKLGHEVTIYTSDYHAKYQQAPVGVKLVKYKCILNFMGGVRVTPGILFTYFQDFDVIHMHNYRTMVNLMAANQFRPCILQAHGSCLPLTSTGRRLTNTVWRDLIINRTNRFIADADMEIDQYQAEGVRLNRIEVIPLGINMDEFKDLPVRTKNGYKTVLYLAKLNKIKGVDILLRAFKLLKRSDTRLMIAGWDDGFGKEIKVLIDELGIEDKVDLVGGLYGQDKIKAMANADVYVVPSRYEAFGLGILEACATGTPIIASDKCAIADQIPRECGTVTTLDESQMAKAINTMLDHDYAKYYRDFRIQWASQYSWDSIAEKVIKVYKEAITERCLIR